MQYVHVKNIERYNPGYKDRESTWCKLHFKIISGDPDFEMLCELDQWRYMKFVILELQAKKPVPLDKDYLARKGFDNVMRSIQLSLQMLQNFLEVCNVEENREEEKREERESKPAHKFGKPTLEEVKSLFQEKGFPAEAEKFFDYYEANGWRVGKNPMKNWRAAVANWLRHAQVYGTQNGVQKPAGRDYKRENAEFAQKLSAWQQESA